MSLIIAVPKEQAEQEERVALDPATVKRLNEREGVVVCIQSGCGRGAGFYDHDYENVQVFDNFEQTVAQASIVVKVTPPTPAEVQQLPTGCTLITQIPAFQNEQAIHALLQRNITTIAMNLLPRITRAQPMDVLSSQATVAGYKAALIAAELSPRMFPMLSTAAGTIRPSRVIVIGAGVAGLQAIATAKRLGAQVEAYDIRTAAREQIESLGARMIDTGVIAEGSGGYARGLNREERQQQHDVLTERLSHAHAVICAAAIPGRQAPLIVTRDMVDQMLPDSILVDMAAETGGNCELTRPGETYIHGHTIIVGASYLPSSGAVHASELHSRNVYNMLKLLVVDKGLVLDWDDEVVSSCILTYQGGLYHEPSAVILELDVVKKDTGESSAPTQTRVSSAKDESAGWIEEDTDVADRAAQEVAIESMAPPIESETESEMDTGTDTGANTNNTNTGESGSLNDTLMGNTLATRTADESANVSIGTGQSGPRTNESSGHRTSTDTLRPDSDSHQSARTDETAPTKSSEVELPPDDLQVIQGIGPTLESRLNEYGVRRYQELAALDDNAAVKLGTLLELGEPDAVLQWVQHAKGLNR